MLLALALTPVAAARRDLGLRAARDRCATGRRVARRRGASAGLLVAGGAGGARSTARPAWLPVAAVAALPFRVPIAAGGTTSSLLVPLYLVIAAGVLAYAVPRLLRGARRRGRAEPAGVWVRRLLAASIVLYAVQAAYSRDFERALQQVVFFYVPFALLFDAAGAGRAGRASCSSAASACSSRWRWCSSAIGFVEYATR